MKSIPTYFTNDFKHWKKIDFFKRIFYAFLFVNTLTLLPVANDIFGYNGIAGYRGFVWGGSEAFLNLLSHPINHKHEWIHWIFIIGQLFFLALGFFRIKPWLSSIAIWFITANLFLKGSMFFTGGEVLVNFILFYLIFIQKPNKKSSNYFLQNAINNTFYIILLIQICVLYFFSTFWKVYDFQNEIYENHWINGQAIYYVSQIESFSSGWMSSLFKNNLWLSKIMTYGVLLYQGTFAILVWIKKLKIPFLIIGTLLHLSIGIGMGIFAFGIIMSITYILFLEEKHIDWLKSILTKRS